MTSQLRQQAVNQSMPRGNFLQYVLNFVDIRKADNKREDIRIENLLLFVNYKTQGL